jgi:hypothetical protein
MEPQGLASVERRLTAILAADVAGASLDLRLCSVAAKRAQRGFGFPRQDAH